LTRTQRLSARAISSLASPLIGALGRTLAWRVEGAGPYESLLSAGQAPILAFWHGRILTGLLHFRNRGIVVITSQNFDGEWIAQIIQRFGFGVARGSSSRGGVRALVQMRRDLASGRSVAFTVDGPRGPARVAQPGAVWLAGATGRPLVPFHMEADRAWTTRSWDRAQIPKPFATVAAVLGEPIRVETTEEAHIETKRGELERSLRDLEGRAKQILHQVACSR
jgi:lysophospholipid acyltransferase (LPLAT)-like uncharacterized protein